MGSRSVAVLALALAALASATGARAQSAGCEPAWMPTAGYVSAPGWTGGGIRALAVQEGVPGGGRVLFAAGEFLALWGGVPAAHVAQWDGTSWSALGSGIGGPNPHVLALAVFDDGLGAGPALYAGGQFSTAGGSACSNIARWDGTSWTDVGGGVTSGAFLASVQCMTIFDDGQGGGPALYVGGSFEQAGGVPCAKLARWDGSSWSPVGGGADSSVSALVATDAGLGGGPELYAGGSFSTIGGVACSRVARWDGASWSALGAGIGSSGAVSALALHDDRSGGGPALYAGGLFSEAGGLPANSIAKWDGTSWSPLGTGMLQWVLGLAEFDDGTDDGPVLFAAGEFGGAGGVSAGHIARWDGASWSALHDSLFVWKLSWAEPLAVFDDGSGSGPALLVGGFFGGPDGNPPSHLAKWVSCSSPALEPWSDLGSALHSFAWEPELVGTGTLLPGSLGSLALTHAPADVVVLLLVSLSSAPTPFKGGVLVPAPPALVLPGITSDFSPGAPGGTETITWADWPNLPSGTELYFQYVVRDFYAAQGMSLSNAVRATVP